MLTWTAEDTWIANEKGEDDAEEKAISRNSIGGKKPRGHRKSGWVQSAIAKRYAGEEVRVLKFSEPKFSWCRNRQTTESSHDGTRGSADIFPLVNLDDGD